MVLLAEILIKNHVRRKVSFFTKVVVITKKKSDLRDLKLFFSVRPEIRFRFRPLFQIRILFYFLNN